MLFRSVYLKEMNEIKNIDMVGRGTREGAALFRDWFQDLTEKAEMMILSVQKRMAKDSIS